MKALRNICIILATLAAITVLPVIGFLIAGNRLAAAFFTFPPIAPPQNVPGFNLLFFIVIAVIISAIALVYILPSLFGFKKATGQLPSEQSYTFPVWFWIGLVMWIVPIVLLFAQAEQPKLLLNYSDLPLFWGFTLLLDGFVYKLRGNSMISKHPTELMGIATASVSGWMLYEYLNLFANRTWYYPFGKNLLPGSAVNDEIFLVYSILGSSALMPLAFEWYDLLMAAPSLKHRFDDGVKITAPKWLKIALIVLSLGGLLYLGYAPDKSFFFLFVWPLIAITAVLSLAKVWTPFTPIKDGNWTPFLVFGLAYLAQGFAMEGWNYFSATHNTWGGLAQHSHSPAFWAYSVPFVDKFHLFEMPILGFLGYLPFSVYCWVWWIMFAYLLGIKTRYFDHTHTYKEADY